MSQWEREALAKCPQKPTFFLRFLDDIIGAWSHGEETFCKVIDVLNNHHPSIKVKYELHSSQVNFLDTTVPGTIGFKYEKDFYQGLFQTPRFPCSST